MYQIEMFDVQSSRTLDLERLRTFETVARLGGFTPAAEALHKTQSTVSAQLKKLEDTAGERLMERNNRGIRLTPAGETLLAYSRRLLQLNAEALSELHAHQLGGVVRVGAPADYATGFLSGVLPAFGRAFPRVEIQVHCDLSSALLGKLAAGTLDLAVGTFDPDAPDGVDLREEQLVWAGLEGGHAAGRRPLPLATFPESCQFRAVALNRLREAGIGYRIACTTPAMSGLETALTADFAVAAVARGSVRRPLIELDESDGLPPLPAMKVTLLEADHAGDAARYLAAAIRQAA